MNVPQRGFAALEGLLILVIIAVISGTGWYAIHTKHQTDKILAQSEKTSQSTPTSKKTASSNTPSVSSSQKFLIIKEWGIKIPLTSNILDAYYTLGERGNNYYNLRSHSLDSEPACTNDDISVAAIERATPIEYQQSQNSDGAGNYIASNSPRIGDYYYYIIHAQYGCAQNRNLDNLISGIEKSFIDATPNIQAE